MSRSLATIAYSVGEFADGQFQTSLVRAINEASPDGILVVNDKDIVVSHNQRFLEVWGIPKEDLSINVPGGSVIGTPDQPILSLAVERVKDPAAFLGRVKELYNNPALDDHCEIDLKDGRTLERHSTSLRGENEEYLGRVWFFRDITTRRRTEAALRDMAEHDPLTGVANRRFFFVRSAEEFSRARRHQRSLSLISMDIDYFKRINDRFGHAAGDEVLKTFCVTCGTLLRRADLLARLGGEEFAVLLPETPLGEAYSIADRLRQVVAKQHALVENQAIKWTVSAGVSTLIPKDATIDDALRRADEALYRAKEGGRNRVEAAE